MNQNEEENGRGREKEKVIELFKVCYIMGDENFLCEDSREKREGKNEISKLLTKNEKNVVG
jgi:hypothetical protein